MFSMDASSSAPHIVGSVLVPQAARYSPRWFDRGDRTYVSIMVGSSVVDAMILKMCSQHPSVRCIKREELPAA